jgi:hypothetical protein
MSLQASQHVWLEDLLPMEDGSTTWESVKDLKESHLLEMAEYAITQGINQEPAFNWWVPQVLQLRKHIISLLKKRKMSYLKKNLKFGIKVPTLVGHALEIDKCNGNTFGQTPLPKKCKMCALPFSV